eukprot:scaffold97255_cov49-Attheya_sp.AAC.6
MSSSRQPKPQAPAVAPSSGIPYGYIPAFLPGSSSLVEQLDRRILIVLRDGRHLVGVFRSFDQFSNMVLEETSERRMVTVGKTCYYADVPLGLYLVRGDSMVLLGEVEEEDDMGNLQNVSLEELEQLQNKKNEETTATTGEDGPVDQERLIWDFDTDLVV